MNCPVCHQPTVVLAKEGDDRRRRCTACQHRFTTTEVLKEERQRERKAVETVLKVAETLKAAA